LGGGRDHCERCVDLLDRLVKLADNQLASKLIAGLSRIRKPII
jgi:hypothetical protein